MKYCGIATGNGGNGSRNEINYRGKSGNGNSTCRNTRGVGRHWLVEQLRTGAVR